MSATDGFVLNQTMLRIKDPQKTVAFYRDVLGMTLLDRYDIEAGKFSLYFMGYPGGEIPSDPAERVKWVFEQPALLEFTHNWGTEEQPDFHYHDGNAQPQGFGHICFSVPDLDAAIRWFDENALVYVKRPEQGRMRDVAFVKDPDGYWIEIVEPARLKELGRGN